MRYLYGESDEKFVKVSTKTKEKRPLASFKFTLNSIIEGKTDEKEFNKTDVPIVFKCTPDTLLNLCVKILDAMPLPRAFTWTIEDICRWLRECGYRQYQNTFRKNLIVGRTLLLLDAAALSAMNIKDFDHINDISRRIRDLFYLEIAKFGRSLTLYPEFHNDLYKLVRVKTGAKYDVPRSNVWRKMQIIRQNEPNYTHWEILENWLNFDKKSKSQELIGDGHRTNLYARTIEPPKTIIPAKRFENCSCFPPCECYSNALDNRRPWRLKCLPPTKSATEYVEVNCGCVPPCTCSWSSKMYQTGGILSCLQKALPHKYGGVYGQIRYQKYDPSLSYRFSYLSYS